MNIKNEIKKFLPKITMPGRYTGGEYGSIIKDEQSNLLVAISFPDLYEIGMSNIAIRLLYNLLNSLEGVTCERVFAPAPDLETELRIRGLPLFSLETGKPLAEFDIIGFSMGYELTITNLLNILDLGKIPYLREKRDQHTPLILAGGPIVANPLPLSQFIDAAFIGEAEAFIQTIFPRLAELKKQGANRDDFLNIMNSHPSIWTPDDPEKKVQKSIWQGFNSTPGNNFLPVPNIKIVQDNGNVEIMRGCPNGCRFCHAGILYRPLRMKQAALIDTEVYNQVFCSGYREITLSSLSTGDYQGIDKLIFFLTHKYKSLGVSFALPSLRINSLSLDILEKISEVRKSGLTFAIETPEDNWQLGLNKEVSKQKIIDLLLNAQKRGWRAAKFYFMIGLPLYDCDESESISNFIKEIRQSTRMNLNINISTFVPKPHTPFQWAAQLVETEALSRIQRIKSNLRGREYKISYHSPFASMIEGLISRGDKEIGNIIMKAFELGARLDSWDEYLDREIWIKALDSYDKTTIRQVYQNKDLNEKLPWDQINLGVKKEYLIAEYKQALNYKLSEPCAEQCPHYCGVCKENAQVITETQTATLNDNTGMQLRINPGNARARLLLAFSKKAEAIYLSHLNCIPVFERAFIRAGYLMQFTEGFNPKPKMEFAHPLSLGISSEEELLMVEILNFDNEASFFSQMTEALPIGFKINKIKQLSSYQIGSKKISLASQFWGSDFIIKSIENPKLIKELFYKMNNLAESSFQNALIAFKLEDETLSIRWKYINKKGYNIIHFLENILSGNPFLLGIDITRNATLAKDKNGNGVSYFEVTD